MSKQPYLQCVICGRRYGLNDVAYTCPDCGEAGTLDILYDYAALRASVDRDAIASSPLKNVWRTRPNLPIAQDGAVPHPADGLHPA